MLWLRITLEMISECPLVLHDDELTPQILRIEAGITAHVRALVTRALSSILPIAANRIVFDFLHPSFYFYFLAAHALLCFVSIALTSADNSFSL